MKKQSDTKSGREPPSRTVFYLDENVDCGTIVTALRRLDICIERHRDHFLPGEDDVVWLPAVAERGWVIITKDRDPQRHPIVRDAFLAAKAKVFILRAKDLTGEGLANLLSDRIRKMDRLARNTRAPCLFKVTAANVLRVEVPGR